MDYQQLTTLLNTLPRWPGTQKFPKYSVINPGFPGNFNMSFIEAEFIDYFGSYLSITHPLIYTKIQPCIRIEDLPSRLVKGVRMHHYLGIFEIADVSGLIVLPGTSQRERTAEFIVSSIWNFLINTLQLDPTRLYVSYFAGGTISDVTENKYRIDRYIEPDNRAVELWLKQGLQKQNLIPDTTRDTFLALHMKRPTPWGYRQEILYDIGRDKQDLLDIGTTEYFLWKPIFENNLTVDIADFEHTISVSAIGVERILMVINHYDSIIDCAHIQPLHAMLLAESTHKNTNDVHVIMETLRVIHRVLTDSGGYSSLSKNRKKRLRLYFSYLKMFARRSGIPLTSRSLNVYLDLNAQLQPWYPELNHSSTSVADQLPSYIERVKIRDE